MDEELTLETANETIKNVIHLEGRNKFIVLVGECFGACIAINFVNTNPTLCL